MFPVVITWKDGHVTVINNAETLRTDGKFFIAKRLHGGEQNFLRSAVASIDW